MTAVSPLTERGFTYVRSVRELGTGVFPPSMPRAIPGTVGGALIILGIGLSLAVVALVGARPSEDEAH